MIRWSCPNVCGSVLGPERPRKDAVCRYCLACSMRSDRLVPRIPVVLEKRRMAAREKRKEREIRILIVERERTAAYYTMNLVNLLDVLRVAWSMPVAKEWRSRRELTTDYRGMPIPALPPELPKLVVSRRIARKLGHANYYRHEIVIFEHAMDQHDVVETVLHEVAHILVGPRRREHHGPAFRATLKTLREEYLATERRPAM